MSEPKETMTDLKPTDPDRTVSTEWAVHIHGMDDVLPALSRLDAYERANEVNTRTLVMEQGEPVRDPDYRPVIWAVPTQMTRVRDAMTVAEVEAMREAWNRG